MYMTKMHEILLFFQKHLVISKKSSTFALAFEEEVIGAVVQLVRIHACHAWGRGFESRPHRKEEAKMLLLSFSTKQSTEFISFLFFFLHICKKSSNFVRFLAFYVLYT